MFTRTKSTLLKIWAESTIMWDPAPSPLDGRQWTGMRDVGKAFIEDVKEALGKR